MDKPNYGHVTSNIAEESNNSVLKADRVLTVYGMLSEFYKRLAFQSEERMKCIAGYNNGNYVLPKALDKINGKTGRSKILVKCFSYVLESSINNGAKGGTVVYKS